MTWVKIKKLDMSGDIIYLPRSIVETLPKQVKFQFGLRSLKVNVHPLKVSYVKRNAFENPYEIQCSEDIIKTLLIKENLTYQLIYKNKTLQLGPVIGFLLGEQSYYYHDRNLKGLTRGMDIFPEIGGLFVAFKDISIDWNNKLISGLYYENELKKWEYGNLPIPSVIFRRAFYTDQKVVEELKKLTGNKVFNSIRFDKWDTYKILKEDSSFKKYLPDTQALIDVEFFHDFMRKYERIVMKPAGLSRGRGICFVHSMQDRFGIYDYRDSRLARFYMLEKQEVDEYLINNFIGRNYIIQPQIALAAINGAPFDMRVVMGKNENKTWQCSGIECRLAGSKNKITNISRGGQALSINNAIRLAFGPLVSSNKIKEKLISIAEEFCKIMDSTGEHFAEFGLDFAIDPQQRFWFIEANVRPVFRGFKRMDYDNYLHIRHMPLFYAASLAGFGRRARASEPEI